MTNVEILSHIDHTVLKADAKWDDIARICEEALQYHTSSVSILQWYVTQAKKTYPELNVCTVVGFPLGYMESDAKAKEAELALAAGAAEIDMVINIAALKNGDDNTVLSDIKAIRKVCGSAILKVIVETCYLTEDEKIRVCKLVTEGGADYIKTSTGFGSAGAQLEDIALFKKHIGPNVKIKAAGGIRTREQMVAFLESGCDRIGCSAARILFDEA